MNVFVTFRFVFCPSSSSEGALFRHSIEPMLYEYGVDIYLAGHVHAYERTHPVFNKLNNSCGITHIALGDGGNYENAAVPWKTNYSTPSGLPEWSAFRESSFGIAGLVIHNATHAR